EVILFDFWDVNSELDMALSCIAVFIVTALYEGLKLVREIVVNKLKEPCCGNGTEEATTKKKAPPLGVHVWLVSHHSDSPPCPPIHSGLSPYAHLHDLQLLFVLAMVLGSGFGYFIFGWQRVSTLNDSDHCH
ncbi:High affinity copper uptake protein 1, partial [Caligus rogercresseyi]